MGDGNITADNGFIYLRSGETPAQKYHRVRQATLDVLGSADPRHKALVARENAELFRLDCRHPLSKKEVAPGSVQDNRFLTNLSVQYKNDDYIGTLLMPVVQTPALAGEYPVYDKRSRFAAPDDSMSNRSTPNEVSDGRSTANYSCSPYALTNHVSVLTLENQQAPLNEMVDLTEAVTDDIGLREEQRIATVMTSAANYASSNTSSLVAAGWDTGAGLPVKNIQDGVAALFTGRGASIILGWCNIDVWNVLARNPSILDLFKYGGGTPGLAKPAQIAEYFGLDGILVSKARSDSANEGQSASYGRIWNKSFGITRVAKNASVRNASFGTTFRFGNKDTRVWFDPKISTKGGYWATVSVHEQHAVVTNDTGYLYTNVIA